MSQETWIHTPCNKIMLDINLELVILQVVLVKTIRIINCRVRENQREEIPVSTITASTVAIPTCSNFSKFLLNNKEVKFNNNKDLDFKAVLPRQQVLALADRATMDGQIKDGLVEALGKETKNLQYRI